jgi:hypothetical protein
MPKKKLKDKIHISVKRTRMETKQRSRKKVKLKMKEIEICRLRTLRTMQSKSWTTRTQLLTLIDNWWTRLSIVKLLIKSLTRNLSAMKSKLKMNPTPRCRNRLSNHEKLRQRRRKRKKKFRCWWRMRVLMKLKDWRRSLSRGRPDRRIILRAW